MFFFSKTSPSKVGDQLGKRYEWARNCGTKRTDLGAFFNVQHIFASA